MSSEEFIEDSKTATKNENTIIKRNEKSKTQEKTDPSGSCIW